MPQDDADTLNRWTEYTGEDLFNERRLEKPSIDVSDNLVKLASSEVVKPISDLARNKSPGEDEIPAELLQAMYTSGKEEITTLINDIFKTGVIKKDLTSGVFVALPKVDKATYCSDHRTISLISHASKILLKVIMKRINPLIDKHLDDTQFGFRKGKGTTDGTFLLRNTCERMMDCQKDLNLCFIDYAKAFNRVSHEKLMEVLARAGIPSHERRLVCEVYWNQSGTTENMIQRSICTANIYCKRLSPKRAAYSSTVSTSTTFDMLMTLSSWQSRKNNFRLCWIASLTNAKSIA
ncbi:RNA-directed DNA polymerase from mobile element jockey-like [Elysia marginata]|uniref:RNA-directed DNA polymerase from mobile element jockey-like n=1 Tax=Elysia marginata TaxID=1093978 RepID=A0AAV4H5V0_9GAST|nr:RNA-directed DNA polymerase from mobile element jockey-like [Elysia marginata]